MKLIVATVFVWCAVAGPLGIRSGLDQTVEAKKSPAAKVAEEFVNLDTSGARLMTKGWQSANSLFEQQVTSRPQFKISVIASHYGLAAISQTSAEERFYFGYEVIGKLDENLQFTATRPAHEVRNSKEIRVVAFRKGPSDRLEWKIVGSQPTETLITPVSAIGYLTKMIENATDPATKNNATKSLETLKPYAR